MPVDDRVLRDTLIEFLRGSSAHADLKAVIDHFPAELYGKKPEGAPHSAWQLLEHIRITLRDLLDFSVNPKYLSLEWPKDYWPEEAAPASKDGWAKSVRAIQEDLAEFERLVGDPATNLYATIPWGDGQTLLREVLLAGDHTSYHLGQIVSVRQALGAWK
jgi:hypothetical protein